MIESIAGEICFGLISENFGKLSLNRIGLLIFILPLITN